MATTINYDVPEQRETPLEQYGVDHRLTDVDFWWGVASGGTHAALHRARDDAAVPTPERLMVSWATKENKLWPGVDWMIDCGGAPETMKVNGGHEGSLAEYAEYLRDPPRKYKRSDDGELNITQYALRDWPCEPGVRDALGLTVDELQQRTLEDHIQLLDVLEDDGSIDAQPVAVLQGWDVDDYLECIDTYQDHGLLTDTVGIGSICRRNTADAVADVRELVQRVRRNLPARVDIHGFGIKQTLLTQPNVLSVFDSVDSAAWEYTARKATQDGIESPPPVDGLGYDDWIDWDDRGNPRYTWRNIQLAYEGYHRTIDDVGTEVVQAGDVVCDLLEWPTVVDRFDGADSDGYPLVECACGTVIDPGRPDPVPAPGCRHCERLDIDMWDRRRATRESTLGAATRRD